MRYDLIDLQGVLKIQGNTGSDNLGLGYSGSNVEWIESQLPGPTSSFTSNFGYNYYIIGATGTPQENAQAVLDLNTIIESLWTNPPALDNRFTVFLTPGEYDFAYTTSDLTPTSFVDFIGLSVNPYETIFRNSANGYVINDSAGRDYGLENIYLPGEGRCYGINDSYPRWKNVVFGGITFDTTGNSWPSIRGEFTDITIKENCHAFLATNTINGIFQNIKAENVYSIFNAGSSINGTFSNIFIDGISTLDSFASTDSLFGNFENIDINNSSVSLFLSRSLNGNFENVKLKNVTNVFEPGASGIVGGYFKNIQIDGATNVFYSLYTISGIFNKLSLKNITTSVFNCGDFEGEIQDLVVSQSDSCSILTCGSQINGQFRNVFVEGTSLFSGLTIFGTYSNINTFNTNCFDADSISLSIKDSKFLGTFDLLFESITFLGIDAQNLRIGNVSTNCLTAENLYGKIQDLQFETCNVFLKTTVVLSCTISNIYGSNVADSCFHSTSASIDGTYRNIHIGDVGGVLFVAVSGLNCDVKNIRVGNVTGQAFSGSQIIGKKFRNITLGNCLSSVFDVTSFDSPDNFFENIEVGNIGGSFFISSDKFDGTYQKIKAGAIVGDFFKTTFNGAFESVNMKGWYKDIEAISCDEAFQVTAANANQIDNIRIENVKINNCGPIMKECRIGQSAVIRNLWVVGDWTPNQVFGSIENSFIDRSSSPSSGIPALQNGHSVIKRSKILSIDSKPIYWDGLIYLSEFNYIGNDNSSFYNTYHNIVDSDSE